MRGDERGTDQNLSADDGARAEPSLAGLRVLFKLERLR
jgi:hypothetical protein